MIEDYESQKPTSDKYKSEIGQSISDSNAL